MRIIINFSQPQALEMGLNTTQAILFSYLYTVPSWAKMVEIDGVTFHECSRNKVCRDMPIISELPDTIYRLFRQLEELGMIIYTKLGKQDLIALTEKGKLWNRVTSENYGQKNSENFPNDGKKSEKTRKKIRKNSENFPTNKRVIDKRVNNRSVAAREKIENEVFEKTENDTDFFNSLEIEAVNTREKLLKKISAGDFFSDTPAARIAVLDLYKEYSESQEFKDQWAAMADTFPKADAKEVIKAWCMNGEWHRVKSVETNRLSNWIRISHQTNLKNAEKSTNNRNGHQISPDRRAEVQRILGWTTGTGEG